MKPIFSHLSKSLLLELPRPSRTCFEFHTPPELPAAEHSSQKLPTLVPKT